MNKKNNNAVKLCGLAVASVLAQGVVADVETVFENGMFRPEISLVADASRPLALATALPETIDNQNFSTLEPGAYDVTSPLTINHPLANTFTLRVKDGADVKYNGTDGRIFGAAYLNISGGKVTYPGNGSGGQYRQYCGVLNMSGGEFESSVAWSGNGAWSGFIFRFPNGSGGVRHQNHNISGGTFIINAPIGLEHAHLYISGKAVVKAEGVHYHAGDTGVALNGESQFELGRAGWDTVPLTIGGGTVKGTADTSINANIRVNAGSKPSSIIADEGKTVKVTGTVTGTAPLTINGADSTGTVVVESGKLATYSGVITVAGGSFNYTVKEETEVSNLKIKKEGEAQVNVTLPQSLHDEGYTLVQGDGDILELQKTPADFTATVGSDGTIEWNPRDPGAEGLKDKIIQIQGGDGDNSVPFNPSSIPGLDSSATIRVDGNLTLQDPGSFDGITLDLNKSATITVNGTTQFNGNLSGYGTVVVNPGSGYNAESENTLIIPKDALDSFAGTLELKSGRHKYATAINKDVKIKVDSGAQLWITGNDEWNNEFDIAGRGWKNGGSQVEQCAIRADAVIGDQATINVSQNSAIGSQFETTIKATFTGPGDLELRGFAVPVTITKPYHPDFTGAVTATAPTPLTIGNNKNNSPTPVKFGSSINVASGHTLKLWLGNARSDNFEESGKYDVQTAITLNNNSTLLTEDGAYNFTNVTVADGATANAELKWKKGYLFDELTIPQTATLNVHVPQGDNRDIYIGVDGGKVDGKIVLSNDNGNNILLSAKEGVLDNATVQMDGNTESFLVLRENVTLNTLAGSQSKGVYGDGQGERSLTLNSGTVTHLKDTKNGKDENNSLSLFVKGEVTISDNLENISGVVALSEVRARLTAPEGVDSKKIVTGVPNYHVEVNDNVYTLVPGADEGALQVISDVAAANIGRALQDVLSGGSQQIEIDAPFGGWFAIVSSDTLDGLKDSTDYKWVEPVDGKLTLTIEKGEGSSRFYQVKASATDPNGEKVQISLR